MSLSVLLKIDDLPGITFDFLQNIQEDKVQVWLDVLRERLIKRNILIYYTLFFNVIFINFLIYLYLCWPKDLDNETIATQTKLR